MFLVWLSHLETAEVFLMEKVTVSPDETNYPEGIFLLPYLISAVFQLSLPQLLVFFYLHLSELKWFL